MRTPKRFLTKCQFNFVCILKKNCWWKKPEKHQFLNFFLLFYNNNNLIIVKICHQKNIVLSILFFNRNFKFEILVNFSHKQENLVNFSIYNFKKQKKNPILLSRKWKNVLEKNSSKSCPIFKVFFFFIFSILWRSQTKYHSQEHLTIFGY